MFVNEVNLIPSQNEKVNYTYINPNLEYFWEITLF